MQGFVLRRVFRRCKYGGILGLEIDIHILLQREPVNYNATFHIYFISCTMVKISVRFVTYSYVYVTLFMDLDTHCVIAYSLSSIMQYFIYISYLVQ